SQLSRAFRGDAHAVGGELHPDLVVDGVLQQLPEVRSDGGLATADVDVEDLHALQLVDDALALLGGQFARVTSSGRRQAVRARQIAGVGELPRQADRRVQAVLEVIDQFHRDPSSSGSGRMVPAASSWSNALTYLSCSAAGTPAAASAVSTSGCLSSSRTTRVSAGVFRKDRRRVAKS